MTNKYSNMLAKIQPLTRLQTHILQVINTNETTQGGWFEFRNEPVANSLGCSLETISRAVRRLVELGYIQMKIVAQEGGERNQKGTQVRFIRLLERGRL